jgi:uncharacterized repeat protein (TIGR01451 family)
MNASRLCIMLALALGLMVAVGVLLVLESMRNTSSAHASPGIELYSGNEAKLLPEPDWPQVAPEPHLVKDINPGAASSSPNYLADVDGTLFFVATDGSPAKELWKSDGTLDGTVLVKEITKSFSIQYLTNVSGTIFFSARETTFGNELWKSDGTPTGTLLVKDINPGFWDSTPEELTNVNGTLFFIADDGTNGIELWKSDGTLTGTVMVKDIDPLGNSAPSWLTNVSGTLFFAADGSVGFGLWKSDGTSTGTIKVANMYPGYLTNVDGTLYFRGSDGAHGTELWKSDGTPTGTVMIKDIWPGSSSGWPSGYTRPLANVNSVLFFIANDGVHGIELWKSDGTETGTVMVKDIWHGSDSSFGSPNQPLLTNVKDTLFFAANDGMNGVELWKSDGTPTGTVIVKDINPGSASGYPFWLTNANGTLFFSGFDGSNGAELWKSDGTLTGTVMVKDINPGAGTSAPMRLTYASGRLFFAADDGSHGQELWALSFPSLAITKDAYPDPVQAGSQLTYTLRVTNTGSADLHAAITDTLPSHITSGRTSGGTLILPGGIITWTSVITGPGGIWVETMVVTVTRGYSGTLTNRVQVATQEGATGEAEVITNAFGYQIYLPLVMKS